MKIKDIGPTGQRIPPALWIRQWNIYRPKRSFGQGNIFTGVCDSVHREGVWSWGGGGVWSWGVYGLGGCLVPGGCLVQGGFLVQGVVWSRGCLVLGVSGLGGLVPGVWSWGVSGPGGGWLRGGRLRGTPHFWGGFFFDFCFLWGSFPPPQDQTPEYGQRSAGTHPTGMHSCLIPMGS